jgi:hypothetical protein
MNAELSKLLASRSSNSPALEQLRTQFVQHQLRRAGDHEALERLAVRGFLVLALAALALWAEPDLAAWLHGDAPVATPVASAASCPGRPLSRWRQNERHSQIVQIHRLIADARDAAHCERVETVRAERESVRAKLLLHDLPMASAAVRLDGESQTAVRDFERMAQRMRDGGYHAARRRAGGSLDG